MAKATSPPLDPFQAIQLAASEIGTDMAGVHRDGSEPRGAANQANRRVCGSAVNLTLLAGHVRHIERRVEALERAKP